jgi:hypothetical protein
VVVRSDGTQIAEVLHVSALDDRIETATTPPE